MSAASSAKGLVAVKVIIDESYIACFGHFVKESQGGGSRPQTWPSKRVSLPFLASALTSCQEAVLLGWSACRSPELMSQQSIEDRQTAREDHQSARGDLASPTQRQSA